MNKDLNKIKKSEEQRLNSLKLKADEYEKKKIKTNDSGKQLNKKKVFADSESSDNEEIVQALKHQEKNEKIKKPIKLFDDEENDDVRTSSKNKKISSKVNKHHSTDDEEDDDSESENEADLFEKKLNIDEDKANKLIYLKSKFSNDSRFKIDERFIESDSENEDKNEINEIQQENENALRILEQITGKPIKKLHEKPRNDGDSKKITKMVRYDPTKEEHKIFEIKNVVESTKSSKKEEIKSDDDNNKLSDDDDDKNVEEEKKANDEPSKFYEIRDDIKNLFCKNEVFKFKFSKSSDEEDEEENEEFEQKEISDDERNFKNYNKIKRSLDYMNNNNDNNNYESSLSSENEDLKEPNEVFNRFKKIDNIDQFQSMDFIPDINEPRLQEALKFFVRPKKLEELHEEWSKERELLVEDYKKKHKKAKRVQRMKDEEKLFVWRKSAFEQKKYKKHKK